MNIACTYKLISGPGRSAYQKAAQQQGHALWLGESAEKAKLRDYIFSCPLKAREDRCAVCETGFFREAVHIDRRGLWSQSSLTTEEGLRAIDVFEPPRSWREAVRESAAPITKYDQPHQPGRWTGVVLAAQIPGDRAVLDASASNTKTEYAEFVRGACEHYGKRLLIKQHPKANPDSNHFHKETAERYGATAFDCDLSVLDHAEFLLVYNSGLAIDALCRGRPVAQFARGYFYRTRPIAYTEGLFPAAVEHDEASAEQLLDFLAWRYCTRWDAQPEDMLAVMLAFAGGDTLFPIPPELSWAGLTARYAAGVPA